MIQRIQSIYLFIQIVILGILFFVPFAEFNIADGTSAIFSFQSIENSETVFLKTGTITALLLLMIGLSLLTIFLFKNRKLQMRLCIYNAVFSIGLIILFVFYIYQITSNLEIIASSYKVWMAIPIASLFCSIQALRGIRKDEIMIKSYDRLR